MHTKFMKAVINKYVHKHKKQCLHTTEDCSLSTAAAEPLKLSLLHICNQILVSHSTSWIHKLPCKKPLTHTLTVHAASVSISITLTGQLYTLFCQVITCSSPDLGMLMENQTCCCVCCWRQQAHLSPFLVFVLRSATDQPILLHRVRLPLKAAESVLQVLSSQSP